MTVQSLADIKDQANIIGTALGRVLFISTAGCALERDFKSAEHDFTLFFSDTEILDAADGDRAQVQLIKLAFLAAIRSGYGELAMVENR